MKVILNVRDTENFLLVMKSNIELGVLVNEKYAFVKTKQIV